MKISRSVQTDMMGGSVNINRILDFNSIEAIPVKNPIYLVKQLTDISKREISLSNFEKSKDILRKAAAICKYHIPGMNDATVENKSETLVQDEESKKLTTNYLFMVIDSIVFCEKKSNREEELEHWYRTGMEYAKYYDNNVAYTNYYYGLGKLMFKQGLIQEADETFSQILSFNRKVVGKNHVYTDKVSAKADLYLGLIKEVEGDFTKAKELLTKGLEKNTVINPLGETSLKGALALARCVQHLGDNYYAQDLLNFILDDKLSGVSPEIDEIRAKASKAMETIQDSLSTIIGRERARAQEISESPSLEFARFEREQKKQEKEAKREEEEFMRLIRNQEEDEFAV